MVVQQQGAVCEPDGRFREILHLDEHVDGAVEVGDRRILLHGCRPPRRRARELAQLDDAFTRAAHDQDVVGKKHLVAIGIDEPLASAPQRDHPHADLPGELDILE